jgi:hypothetical protein
MSPSQRHHRPVHTRRRPVREQGLLSPALVQAAALPAQGVTAPEAEASLEAVETFATAVGGRDALLDTLAIAGTAPECERVVNLLLDVRYRQLGLRRLCAMAGLTVADLFAAYKKALIVKAHVEAARAIAGKLPAVVDDVMTRAVPTAIRCPECHNAPDRRPRCWRCLGTGQAQSEPELERQKLALELGQLLEKKGGLSIVNQNLNAATAGAMSSGPLEQLQQAVGDLLFAPTRRRAQAPQEEPPVEAPPRQEPPLPDLPFPGDEGHGRDDDPEDEGDVDARP